MVNWIWIPIAMLFGAVFAILVIALCAANEEPRKRKWWDE